jgi:hypothetical protein
MVKSEAFKQADFEIKSFLIEDVRMYPAIWQLQNADHMKGTVVNNAWCEILADLKERYTENKLVKHKMTTFKEVKVLLPLSYLNVMKVKATFLLNRKHGRTCAGCTARTRRRSISERAAQEQEM